MTRAGTASLTRSDPPYPHVALERWTRIDGWPWTFKIALVTAPGAEPDYLDAEFETVEAARPAARAFARAHGGCPIIEDGC